MTDASEVVVTDQQLSDLAEALQMFDPTPGTGWHARYRQIICEFIAARVPDRMGIPNTHAEDSHDDAEEDGFNVCRGRVLRGTP